MLTLIPDLSSYIWLCAIVFAVFATFDTGEGFSYNVMGASFAAMLFSFTGVGFYIQCAVFFALLIFMCISVTAIENVIKRKNRK